MLFAEGIDWQDQDITWTDGSKITKPSAIARLNGLLGTNKEPLVQKGDFSFPTWAEEHFVAGRLSKEEHVKFWETVILPGNPRKDFILENLKEMRPSRYFKHFKGSFMGLNYDEATPPSRQFENHFPPGLVSTGEDPESWAFKKVMADVKTGAIRIWGKVGEVKPPHVVLPLGVEPLKPRLITDARYINLWGDTGPFSLDSVGMVPETFRRDGAMNNYDHRSGYHHHVFAEDEQEYFGFKLRGFYFVFAAGCFGWSKMPEIYHLTHMALLGFTQKTWKIPSLGYLDDCCTGSLFGPRLDETWILGSARYSISILGWINFLAGYSISIKKSILEPCFEIIWLGILIDASQNKFFIPEEKKQKLLTLIKGICDAQAISITQLESVAGKCMSLQLAVSGRRSS